MTELKITQADRDAAADLNDIFAPTADEFSDRIRRGNLDDYCSVQAFARHRADSQAELVEAADELQAAEAEYRRCHDIFGGGHTQAGRAWDVMRRAGDRLRAALARVRGEG